MDIFFLTLALLVALILFNVPVGFAFGIGAFFFSIAVDTDISFHLPHAYKSSSGFALLALPLFIIAGSLMTSSSISDRLLNFINVLVGRMRGGLGAVTVVACTLFGAISGSAAAAIAAIGQIMVPRMIQQGYSPGYATSLVACSSVLSMMIPPSIPMIVFAITSGISVSAAFLSTVIPGLILCVVYIILNFMFVRKDDSIVLQTAPSNGNVLKEVTRTGKEAGLALLMPIIVLGGIYGGLFTPTEAAAVAVIYSTIIGLYIYKSLSGKEFYEAIIKGVTTTGSIFAVLFFLFVMSRVMVLQQIPATIADTLMQISQDKIVVLIFINIALLLIGMIVDDISGSVLASVIFMPIVTEVGIHPIHFAAIVGTNLGLGNVSPPCAPLLYMAGGINNISIDQYVVPALKFLLLGHLPIVFLVTFYPDMVLFLPRTLLGIM